MIALRTVSEPDWRAWRQLRLEALREAPDAFGSTLDDWQGNGDAEARWRKRLADVPFNVIAELDAVPAGMVSATSPDIYRTLELISMWVAPFARGRGVGDALVAAVIQWAARQHARRLTLDVRDHNGHARGLYHRHGFADEGVIDEHSAGPQERRMSLKVLS